MPKRIKFTQDDAHLAGVLFEQLNPKRSFGGGLKWLVIEPAAGKPDVKVEVNKGDGDPDAMNVILNVSDVEPGKPAYPELAERGVTTPSGWILMADVGWVLGWRTRLDTPFDKVTDFAFRATRALSGEVPDHRWVARIEKRGPRPGYTNPKI